MCWFVEPDPCLSSPMGNYDRLDPSTAKGYIGRLWEVQPMIWTSDVLDVLCSVHPVFGTDDARDRVWDTLEVR